MGKEEINVEKHSVASLHGEDNEKKTLKQKKAQPEQCLQEQLLYNN